MAGAKFIKVKISQGLARNMKRAEDVVLREMAPLAETAAHAALERSKAAVPVESGDLRASAYARSAAVDRAAHFVSAEVGYGSDHAAYVHEGAYGSRADKQATPPKFLSKATRKGRAKYRKAVAAKLAEVLNKLFPPPSK